jgi:hypothetical protein
MLKTLNRSAKPWTFVKIHTSDLHARNHFPCDFRDYRFHGFAWLTPVGCEIQQEEARLVLTNQLVEVLI